MVSWLDRLQRRSRSAGFLIAVIYKYVDDQGSYLAALITYYAFVSLFPALLLLTTVLGVVLVGYPELQEQILQSAVAQFPVIGGQLGQPQGLSGGTAGVVVGIAGALYGGLGVGQAVQNAMDTLWAVPRNDRPDPIRARIRSFLLLLVLGSALIVVGEQFQQSLLIQSADRIQTPERTELLGDGICTRQHLLEHLPGPGQIAAASGPFLQNPPPITINGQYTNSIYQMTVQSANLQEIYEWAPRLMDRMRSLIE
jgi:hypothetical protein